VDVKQAPPPRASWPRVPAECATHIIYSGIAAENAPRHFQRFLPGESDVAHHGEQIAHPVTPGLHSNARKIGRAATLISPGCCGQLAFGCFFRSSGRPVVVAQAFRSFFCAPIVRTELVIHHLVRLQ